MSTHSWKCPVCALLCNESDIKCPACEQLRPGYESCAKTEETSARHPRVQFGSIGPADPTVAAQCAALDTGTPGFGPGLAAAFPGAPSFIKQSLSSSQASLPVHNPFLQRPSFGVRGPPETSTPSTPSKPTELGWKDTVSKTDGGRFTFGVSNVGPDLAKTPAGRVGPRTGGSAAGDPSPGMFLDALATTPAQTSGPDSPLLRDYDPDGPKLALRRDPSARGILYNWGSGECDQLAARYDKLVEGMLLIPMIIRRVNHPIAKQICCGTMHSACVVDNGKTLYTWGCNDEKALGRPVKLDTKRMNAAGEIYELPHEGPVVDPCWNVVPPHPSDPNHYVCKAPGPVWGLPENVEIVKVTAGDSHTAVVTATGDCWCWGTYRDGTGPLGFPDFSREPGAVTRHQVIPVKVPGLTGSCIRLLSGENHTVVMTYCARDGQYRIYAWGSNPYAQLGRPATDHTCSRRYLWPHEIKLSQLEFSVAASEKALTKHPRNHKIKDGVISDIYGGRATLFIKVTYDGFNGVFGMGRNACGELGGGCEKDFVATPVELKTPPGFVWKDIRGGDWFTMGYSHDGAVFTWGHCEYVGLGSEVAKSKRNVLTPRKIPGLKQRVAEIAASDKSAFVVTLEGQVFAWGENQSGQLCLGKQDEQPVARPTHVPQKFFTENPVLSIAAGAQHAVAMVQVDERSIERGTKRRRDIEEESVEPPTTSKRPRPESADNTPWGKQLAQQPEPARNVYELPRQAPAEMSPAKDLKYPSDQEHESSDSSAEMTEPAPSDFKRVPNAAALEGYESDNESESAAVESQRQPPLAAKARRKQSPIESSGPENSQASSSEVKRGRKRPVPFSHTPEDVPQSDLSAPSEVAAPKRTRATASRRKPSVTPPPESAEPKRTRAPRATRKPLTLSQENATPMPLAVDAPEPSPSTRATRAKANPTTRGKAAPAPSQTEPPKRPTRKRTVSQEKNDEEAEAPAPSQAEPPKRPTRKRTVSQEKNEEEVEAPKAAPKRAARGKAAPKKSQTIPVSQEEPLRDSEPEETSTAKPKRSARGRATTAAAPKAEVKGRSVSTGEEEGVKKGKAKAKAKAQPKRGLSNGDGVDTAKAKAKPAAGGGRSQPVTSKAKPTTIRRAKSQEDEPEEKKPPTRATRAKAKAKDAPAAAPKRSGRSQPKETREAEPTRRATTTRAKR